MNEDSREQARQRALKIQPWVHSTGPKTEEGKRRSATNALKHGRRSRNYALSQKLRSLDEEVQAALDKRRVFWALVKGGLITPIEPED